ncbi:MAG: hypothetical protein KC492_43920, partial [Myxococcales bacterium]|nr:hypothetical protein [Myxococcales bacterium]
MADLSHFELSDILGLAGSLRGFSAGTESMEAVAHRVVDFLFAELTHGGDKEPALVLARLYKT